MCFHYMYRGTVTINHPFPDCALGLGGGWIFSWPIVQAGAGDEWKGVNPGPAIAPMVFSTPTAEKF